MDNAEPKPGAEIEQVSHHPGINASQHDLGEKGAGAGSKMERSFERPLARHQLLFRELRTY